MTGSKGGKCYSVSTSGCRWIVVLVGLICAFLVSEVFPVTRGLEMLIANTRVVFSTTCAASVFGGALGYTVVSKAVKTKMLFLDHFQA